MLVLRCLFEKTIDSQGLNSLIKPGPEAMKQSKKICDRVFLPARNNVATARFERMSIVTINSLMTRLTIMSTAFDEF